MILQESINWLERASEYSSYTRDELCAWAGYLTNTSKPRRLMPGMYDGFTSGMVLYGIAYWMDYRDGELTKDNTYAFGWASYAMKKVFGVQL